MKLKFISLLLITISPFSYASDNFISLETEEKHLSSNYLFESVSDKTIDIEQAYINTAHVKNPKRFFNLLKSEETTIFQQFKDQLTDIYQSRKTYFQEQEEFLQSLLKKSKEEKITQLKQLHPLFYDDEYSSIDLLKRNTNHYQQSILHVDKHIEFLNDPNHTFNSLFNNYMALRLSTFQSRENRREKGSLLPSTKSGDFENLQPYEKFVALEAIENFRLLDEILYALFPHITKSEFINTNEITPEKTAISQDYALMEFLSGEIKVPYDPDTSFDMRTTPGKLKNVFVPHLNRYVTISVPIIPKKNIDLFTKLKDSLPNGDVNDSFLPPHVKKFLKSQKQEGLRLNEENQKKSQKKKLSALEKNKSSSLSKNLDHPVERNSEQALTSTIIKKEKPTAITPLKPLKPEGGWSQRDQERSLQSKAKVLCSSSTENNNEELGKKFYPDNPIFLTGGQYKTLQEILDETTPSFTLTFEKVKELLEAIGIKVDRNGGSHAHISTPGRNIKILVDVHYGWTNKFGPTTINNLRKLMLNLGMNHSEFVKVRE